MELEHFGILGMHWGVRKQDNQTSSNNFAKGAAVGVTTAALAMNPTTRRLGVNMAKTSVKAGRILTSPANVGRVALKGMRISGRVLTVGGRLASKSVRTMSVTKPGTLAMNTMIVVAGTVLVSDIMSRNRRNENMYHGEIELEHYGVKGMHWGVRKDDYSNISDDDMTSKIKRSNLENSYHKSIKKNKSDKYQTSSDVSRELRNVTQSNKHLVDTVWKDKNTAKDVSLMSDAELRATVNRMDMERRYQSLSMSPSPGKTKALEVLDISGDVLAVTASALLIAGKLYMMRR